MRGKEVSRRRSSLSRKIRQAYTLTSTYIYIYICIDRHLRWAAIILGTHLVAAFSGTLRWRRGWGRGRRWSSSLGHCHVASVVVCFLPNCVCVYLPHLAKFCPTWHSPTAHLLTTLLCLPSPPDSYSACCLLPPALPASPFVLSNFGAHVFMPQMALLRQRILFFTATFRHFALSFLFSARHVGVARALC